MSGYIGSRADKVTFHDSKPYSSKDVKDCVRIRKHWYWLTENKDPETIEMFGRYSAHILAWGSQYIDWNSFSPEEKELLKTTLK